MIIRVFLGESSQLVRSTLQAALGDCHDIELVDSDASTPPSDGVDVVVLQKRWVRNLPVPLGAFAQASRLRVVAINDDGQTGDLYRIFRSGWHFSPGGKNGLADAIRAVVRAD